MAINPRISEMYRYGSALDRMGSARSMVDEANETIASGRKLRQLSDDPAAAVRVMRNRAQLANLEQFKKTIQFSKGFLSKSEETVHGILDALNRAKEIGIQQANSTNNSIAREAAAQEMRHLVDQVVDLGNASYNDKYIFGGFQTKYPPISHEGHYMGDDGQIFVQIDRDTLRPINLSGREIFDVQSSEEGLRPPLISILNTMQNSLLNEDMDGLHKNMGYLDAAMSRVITSLTELGSKRGSLEGVEDRLSQTEIQLHSDNSQLEGADMFKAAIDLKKTENALQFSLQASSKMLTPSLLEFLK